MREFSAPDTVEVPDDAKLTDAVFEAAASSPDAVAFSRRVDGQWQDITSRRFRDDVLAVAKGLVARGLRRGDRVALLSRTRYEWTVCDYGIWSAGAVTVPIYETSSPEQVRLILADSGARAIFVETGEQQRTVRTALRGGPDVEEIWRVEGRAEEDNRDGKVTALDELRAAGANLDDQVIEQRRRAGGADELATIVYTSGTTGAPKGCELTHRNLLFAVRAALAAGLEDIFAIDNASILLFLPLAHVLPRVIQVGCLESRVRLGFSADTKQVLDDLAGFRPRFILSVPRVFEKVYNSAAQQAAADGKGGVFTAAADTAVAYSRALDAGGPGTGLKVKRAVFDKLVYGKLRDALGGEVSYAVSGGAALGERLCHFFRGIGVPVFEGYGATETSAPTAFNTPRAHRLGTVGKPLPGTAARIADDGEILVKGPHVFRGYWHNPAATKDAFDAEGWFHTGDMGELDEDGFLRVTGRKKELIVTASGKNVAPAVLEDRLRLHALVSQCMVVGEGRPYVAALVTLDPEALGAWKARHGKPANTGIPELRDDHELTSELQDAVDEANAVVSRAESIRRFRVLADDFTEDSGHLTPTLKVKRNIVARDCSDDIEALYT